MNGVEGTSQGVRKYFYFIKENVSSDWKNLAYQLGVGPADISNIAGKNQDNKSHCMDLLEEWLKRKGEKATIEALMEALSEAKLQNIVDGLKKKYPELSVGVNQAQTDISELHSKHGFKVEELKLKEGGEAVQGSSIPLILPNDLKYNASTGSVEKLQDAPRKNLQVVPEALELLERIEEPVSVLAICGPCRTGKSYILSRLLGAADAFELGHSMDPHTFGIWMGTKVLRGKDFTIVLLDTEGIDAVGGTAGQDASILVLTILLSSQLIYNSLNVPHKGDLESMHCFTQLAKRVTVKQGEYMSAFNEFFPDFLWLLRDVSLNMLDDDGKVMTPTEYLTNKVLKSTGGERRCETASVSKRVGLAIREFFPSVECAILERPSEKKDLMLNIAQHTDRLNPQFNKGVQDLIEMLLQKSHAMRGYEKNSTIRGLALSIMTEKYVEAVNDPNSIPALDNTWQNTIELMQNRAIEEAVTEYNKQMQSQIAAATNNGLVPLEENAENAIHLKALNLGHGKHSTRNPDSLPTLMDLHNRVLDDVTKMLLEKVGNFGISSEDHSSENKNLVDRLQNRLVQREERSVDYLEADGTTRKQEGFIVTGGELLHYIQKNRELSKNFCQGLSERLVGKIREHVDSPSPSPTYDFDALLRMVTDAYEQYDEKSCGPEKWIVQQEMAKNLEKLKAEIEKIKAFQTKILQAQQRERDAEKRAKQLSKKADEMQQLQQTQQEKLERMEREQEAQLQLKIEKEKQEWDEQHKDELKEIDEHKKRAKELKEDVERMEQEKRDVQLQLIHESGSNKEMSKQITDMKQILSDTQQTQQEMERRYTEQIEEMKREMADRQRAQEVQNAERERKDQEEREKLRNALSEKEETIRKKEQMIREKDETIQKKEQDLANVSRICSLL